MKQVKFSVRKATSVVAAILCLGASATAFAQVEAKVTGRVQFDARNISNSYNVVADRDSASVGDTFEVRRARIGVAGKINKDISYEVVGNGVGSSTNWVDTAWGNYGFNKNAQVRVGRFKQPFSLEEQTSSNNIDFMERSYGNAMVPGKRLGVMLHGAPLKGLTYAASIYQDGFNELTNQSSLGTKQVARLTLNLAEMNSMKDSVLHIGAGYTGGDSSVVPVNSGNTQSAADTTTRATLVSLRSENRGQANVYRAQIGGDTLRSVAASGQLPGYNVSANNAVTINQKLRGIELAGARGPFKFQMETFNSKYDAKGTVQNLTTLATSDSTAGVQVKTDYMEFMYNITGESWADAYKGGAFGGIKPKSVFMKDYGGVVGNGTGAWQAGYRTSKYAASNFTFVGTGGREQNTTTARTNTYALNWVMNSNARVMFNYAETKFGTNITLLDTTLATVGTTDKERVISVRSQFNF
jgi:phosphate-selective porin OprO/OprP